MSSENGKREQAAQLLSAMTDIDDRFLMEAMDRDLACALDDSGQSDVSGQADRIGQTEDPSGQTKQNGNGPRRGRLRRYSTWALTAAACLTVVIVGRYVSVNSVKNAEQTNKAAVEMQQSERYTMDADAAAEAADELVADAEEAGAEDSMAGADQSAALQEEYAGEAQKPPVPEEAPAIQEAEEAPAMAAGDTASEPAVGQGDEQAVGQSAAQSSSIGLAHKAADAAGAGAAMTVAMPNPFIDTETLEEAEEEAGFSLTLPKVDDSYDTVLFRAMKDQMIEVIWMGESDQEMYRVRKAKNGEDDISGDYNEYAASDVIEAGKLKITVSGDKEGEWKNAVWTEDAKDGTHYSYSITADSQTLTDDEVIRFAEEMTE